nr:RNA-directed DNA polymerase, eukaryota [Tanacetum cinerariifolium]
MTTQDSQSFHWRYDDLDDKNFQIRGRTLFFLIVLFSVILLITLLFLYARWICRRSGSSSSATVADTATAAFTVRPFSRPQGLDTAVIDSLPITLHQRLFHLEKEQNCLVRDCIANGSWSWDWSKSINVGRSQAEFVSLLGEVGHMKIEDDGDSCIWSLSHYGGSSMFDAFTWNPSFVVHFKIIVKGKVFNVRAKELFTWNPPFVVHKETDYASEEGFDQCSNNKGSFQHHNEEEIRDEYDSDDDGVPETVFGSISSSHNRDNGGNENTHSEDLFEIYQVLENKKGNVNRELTLSLSHPPGFIPEGAEKCDKVIHDMGENVENVTNEPSDVFTAKVMNTSQDVPVENHNDSVGTKVDQNGGLVLGVMEDIIRIGQSMGYTMEGCVKDFASIIGQQGDNHGGNFGITYRSSLDVEMESLLLWVISTKFGIVMSDIDPVLIHTELDTLIVSSLLRAWSIFIWKAINSRAAVCLDRHLSDHRLILLREAHLDFGPTPFRFYRSWFELDGFDDLIKLSWQSFSFSDFDGMTRFKKKLKDLKVIIRRWVSVKRLEMSGSKTATITELAKIDKAIDSSILYDTISLRRLELKNTLLKIMEMESKNNVQKSKVKWAVEGDENLKFFHGIINKRRSQLAIRARFKKPDEQRFKLNFQFHKKLLQNQSDDLESKVTCDEIRKAVWNCGDNKSPGPDGYTFEFFKKYWDLVGSDFSEADEYFFINGAFSKGCNSSFVMLILKVVDAKQILDDPFILDEILNWCKRAKKQVMFFKVDFAKAYDSVRWDYLLDVLEAFGFGNKWRSWIRGIFNSNRASILVNGSPSNEFSCFRGLKQGDPLAPYLFILIMESLHLSFNWVVEEGLFKGIQLPGPIVLSYLFYADDAIFIGEWPDGNLKEVHKLKDKGFDFWSHCKKRIGDGTNTSFWSNPWLGDIPLKIKYPRLFSFELDKDATVAVKLQFPMEISFRRNVRGGIEQHLMEVLAFEMDSVLLSNSYDRWRCDLSSDGDFRVEEV